MTSKEIISKQMTEMRQELITAERKLANIKLLLDLGAYIYKNPIVFKRGENQDDACGFDVSDYEYLKQLRERMYAAIR